MVQQLYTCGVATPQESAARLDRMVSETGCEREYRNHWGRGALAISLAHVYMHLNIKAGKRRLTSALWACQRIC